MAQFDPRRQPIRFAPHLFTAVAAVLVAGLAWRINQPASANEAPPLTAAQVAALESQALSAAAAPAGMTQPEPIEVRVRPGETFEQAVARTGIDPEEARAVTRTLASAYDVVNIRAGLTFDTAISRPRTGRGAARLVGLTMRTGPATQLTVSRSFDGALKVRSLEERVTSETTVANGEIHGSLYESAARLGANSRITAEVVKLFSHRLDFSRDIKAGDPFTLIFDRQVTESGRTVATGELLYAEVKGVKFYRFEGRDGRVQYFDEQGKNIRGFLLQTPIDGARISSNFGMRRHPIAGYRRMHQGIDFAAGMGTPVVSAADGVVVEARRWGGYGNWVRIRHTGGWETGYAHLSRYARGLRAGQRVRQGQVIAYVGSTGASTGPHLHYELWRNGQRVNPRGARVPQGTVLAGADLAAFRAQKSRIDAMVAERRTASEDGLRGQA
ncbi:peptidoglycan DD-metalloendopeptidase family protein [Brevundimonas sp. 2R-24]|uniref:Peptidoglycan DD-metalloendopeptidase family protein n=1 Tax=Peiella sedimenti TaxID=3061083 RepID=A0ABT8SP98_9CAUL|nr:peptidoglycan DD-metalloendopeptidase family protein [Caulobacteraceae bacterium XZ-24]